MLGIVSIGFLYRIIWRMMTFAKRGKDTTTNGGKYTCSPECIYIKTDIYKVRRMQKVAPQKSLLIALCIILKKFGPMHLYTATSRLDYTWHISHLQLYYGKFKSENSRSSSFSITAIDAEHQVDQTPTYINNKQINSYWGNIVLNLILPIQKQ